MTPKPIIVVEKPHTGRSACMPCGSDDRVMVLVIGVEFSERNSSVQSVALCWKCRVTVGEALGESL